MNAIGIAAWSLLTIYSDGHVVTSTGIPTRHLCEEARSYVTYGLSIEEKAVSDRKEADRLKAEAEAWPARVAAWRAKHPCEITGDEMSCTLPDGGNREFEKLKGEWVDIGTSGVAMSGGGGDYTIDTHGAAQTVSHAVCTPDE